MRKSSEIIDVLQEAVVNRTNPQADVVFPINVLDALDLEDVTEEILIAKDFDERVAEEIVAGLQIGQLEPLGKVMGVKFVLNRATASLWGNS